MDFKTKVTLGLMGIIGLAILLRPNETQSNFAIAIHGGAIALGHPLGCSGTRILITLIHQMKKRDTKYGLATLCVGVGQGVTTLVEGL